MVKEGDAAAQETEASEEMPRTLEVLRKHDDVEQRRRSVTLRVESSISSSDSRKATSYDRSRHSGINRLLRSSNDVSDSGVSGNGSGTISAEAGPSNDSETTSNAADTDTPSSPNKPPSSPSHASAPVSLVLSDDAHGTSGSGVPFEELAWSHVVLKMSSFSDEDEVTSFRFGREGGTIGRDASNTAAIPADKLLSDVDHARVLYRHGRFYLTNLDPTNTGTFIRLSANTGTEEDKMQWPLDVDVVFRAGKSDFRVHAIDESVPVLELTALSGKLAGSVFTFGADGGGIGRSAENLIHAGDGELSRRHCAIWFDKLTSQFYLLDLDSTNGTFMKLIGAYQEPYRLEIGDDLLISQTCLTVNRFDYGAHANMGARKQMEDAHTIIQDLDVPTLRRVGLHPQSFFAVYDGHGGMEASTYLGEMLHHNILSEFRSRRRELDVSVDAETDIDELLGGEDESAEVDICDIGVGVDSPRPRKLLSDEEIYEKIESILVAAFQRTDDDFLAGSERPQAGSTATTVFVAGSQLFVANVGDSRTVLSRRGEAVRLSNDHKPSRPDEAQRIRDTGGFVIHGRIMGELAVSRAFGDSPFKTFELPEPPRTGDEGDADGSSGVASKPRSEYDSQELPVNPNEILKGPLVIATPEITRTELTDDEEFLLLASDGLFDVLKDQEAIDFIRAKIVALGDVQRAVEAAVEHAIVQQRSMDNVTAVVVMFKEPSELTAEQQ